MPRNLFVALTIVVIARPVLAAPPADLDACIDLSTRTTKAAMAKIKTEGEYTKFHIKMMSLDSSCGSQDFAGAEKIADEIKGSTMPTSAANAPNHT